MSNQVCGSIKVQLVRKKGVAPPKVAPKAKPKAKGKAKDQEAAEVGAADLLGENGPQVSMIIILGEAAPGR